MCLLKIAVLFLAVVSARASEDSSVSEEEPEVHSVSEKPSERIDDAYIGSPYVDAKLAFASPPYGVHSENKAIALQAGKPSSVVISLANTHEDPSGSRFTLDTVEGALHYPLYFTYRIQNFTVRRLQNTLEPGQQAAISYSFVPSDELAGQSFGLSIIVNYHDEAGFAHTHAVFNQTVAFYDEEEGVDTELIFLSVLIAAIGVLVCVALWHLLGGKMAKRKLDQKSNAKAIDELSVNEYATLLNQRPKIPSRPSEQKAFRRHGKR